MKKSQFYRFDKPEDDNYPKMIELFSREDFALKEKMGITPIHIDDDIVSLSAILLNDDYYSTLLQGKIVENGLSVLRPEYLILFKAKAYLDLKSRKESGESVDSSDINKHKKDILRIASEMMLERVLDLPQSVEKDIYAFINMLASDTFDNNMLREYGLKNQDVIDLLNNVFLQ